MPSFSNALLAEILKNKNNDHVDNVDAMMQYDARFCKSQSTKSIINKILNARIPVGYQLEHPNRLLHVFNPKKFYLSMINSLEEMSFLYDALNDSNSKELLLKLLAYKILGHTKVKLPRNNPTYWADIKAMAGLEVGHGDFQINFLNLNLPFLDLNSIGYQVKVNVTHAGAAAIFKQKQYEYTSGNFSIKAEKDDVVLDCGACWGETSLYFAHEVGTTGEVYSFEFIPENVEIFRKNIAHNPHLINIVRLIEHPVWNVSDENLFYSDHGPGSSISSTPGIQSSSQVCKTLSIDDCVDRFNIRKVDFIKMDIEGAEMNALIGAVNTLKKFKPKLAISVYHKPDDFITIPKFINNLDLDYEFYLDHHTIHFWETVLYAIPRDKKVF